MDRGSTRGKEKKESLVSIYPAALSLSHCSPVHAPFQQASKGGVSESSKRAVVKKKMSAANSNSF